MLDSDPALPPTPLPVRPWPPFVPAKDSVTSQTGTAREAGELALPSSRPSLSGLRRRESLKHFLDGAIFTGRQISP